MTALTLRILCFTYLSHYIQHFIAVRKHTQFYITYKGLFMCTRLVQRRAVLSRDHPGDSGQRKFHLPLSFRIDSYSPL